jgi:tetratricopeptide (TPR) repeat protein
LHDHLDEVVTRGDIYEELWPDSEADVNRGLNTLVRQLRMGLGDTATEPRFVRTYQARGYRLLPVAAPAVVAAAPECSAAGSDYAPGAASSSTDAMPAPPPHHRIGWLWTRRPLVPLAAAVGVALAMSIAHARGLPGGAAIAVHVAGVTQEHREAWRGAVSREATRHQMSPRLVFLDAAGGASRVFVTCEVEGDTVWSASLAGVSVGGRDSLIAEALAAARANPDVGRALPVAARMSPDQAESVARGRHLLRLGRQEERHQAAVYLARALQAGARLPGLRADYAEALFHAGHLDSAYRVARQSIEEEPEVATGWFMSGVTAHLVFWDWDQAERQLARAIRLDPNVARFHSALAFVRATAGDRGGARLSLERAARTGAEDALTRADIGHIYHLIGDDAAAAGYCATSLELADAGPTRRCLAEARLASGDTVGARVALGDWAGRGIVEWRARWAEAALRSARTTGRGGVWYGAAEALAAAGRREEALEAIQRAISEREPWAVMATTSPALLSLAADPRWPAIVNPIVERGAGAAHPLPASRADNP